MSYFLRCIIVLVLVCFTSMCQAQIGSGWSAYTSQHNISADPGYYYSNSGGVETFRISGSCNRSEIHLTPNYTSGSRQFEGSVNVKSGANSSSVQQVMEINGSGDAHQIRVYNANGGYLKVLQNGVTVATGVYGKYVRVNVINYGSTGSVETWINGSKKSTYNIGQHPDGHYFKYGVYMHPENNPQVQWKSIKTWKK